MDFPAPAETRTTGDLTRYQRKKEISNVVGFVVNIHDATNFDIDLDLPEHLRREYHDVIAKRYSYINVP